MKDLPYEPETILNATQCDEVKTYCWNDTKNTKLIRDYLKKDIKLRDDMSVSYGINLRSRSDAQIAEAVIGRELYVRYGIDAKKPKVDFGISFSYQKPENIKFNSKQLNDALHTVLESKFTLSDSGKIKMPEEIAKLQITFGSTRYNMGMGGLHSQEEKITHTSDENQIVVDRDVASYYPMIILNQELFPHHIGKRFLDIYRGIVERRLKAKEDGDTATANSLKITINGSFGKFGSMHSLLFAPELLIQTTMSGQLYLLMLIERLTEAGFNVVSGNTDGIVTVVPRVKYNEFDAIVAKWEKDTGFNTEETEYSKLCSRDVNNYIAIKTDGKIKSKGCYAESNIGKNPIGEIINDAVRENLLNGTSVEETINGCKDIRKFVFVRKVDGGCKDDDNEEIGKVIRWYYKKGQFVPLRYVKSGNKVPKSDGAYPIMNLPVDLPQDIDYARYIHESKKILREDFNKSEQLALF